MMKKRISISPIGFVQNRFNTPSKKIHIRAKKSKIILLPQYVEGLFNINKAKYLEVIFYFHKSKGYKLTCKTHHWGIRGVFACRGPFRPVSLGLTKVKLMSVNKNELVVEGLDAINGTPVLDIKPYVDWGKQKKEIPCHGKQKGSEKRNQRVIGKR